MSKKSPQLRFEGFTDDWELRKLGDEVKINGRIGFRGYTQADIVTKETGVLAYSPTNIVNNRLYRKQSDTYITKQKYRDVMPQRLYIFVTPQELARHAAL